MAGCHSSRSARHLLAVAIGCPPIRPHAAASETIPMSIPSFENPLADGPPSFADMGSRFDRSARGGRHEERDSGKRRKV